MDLQQIFVQLIGLLSLIVGNTLADEISEETRALLQQVVPNVYSATKFALPPIVIKTPNVIDDAGNKEVSEICEVIAAKYGLELNPENVNLKLLFKK